MKWKLAVLAVGVAVLLGILYMLGTGRIQGFQNPRPSEDTFTMYYAEWCPHCKTAMPEFDALIEKGSVGGCKIRKVEASEKDKMAGKNIGGFPTFLLETTDGSVAEYKGSRSLDGYLKFLNERLGVKADVS